VAFLKIFGPNPVQSPTIPSEAIIFLYASIEPLYLLGTPAGNLPSAYNLTFTTSVGLATQIPIAPVVKAAKIFLYSGISPLKSLATYKDLTVSYRPILNEAKTICLYKPALKPLNKDKGPSSFAIVIAVFTSPLYFPTSPFYKVAP